MRVEKKTVRKEDGRYLVYYHFPDSANAEQTAVFAAITDGELQAAPQPPAQNSPAPAAETPQGGNAHV